MLISSKPYDTHNSGRVHKYLTARGTVRGRGASRAGAHRRPAVDAGDAARGAARADRLAHADGPGAGLHVRGAHRGALPLRRAARLDAGLSGVRSLVGLAKVAK